MTNNLFSGLYNLYRDSSKVPLDTERVFPVKPGDKISDPRKAETISSLIDTPFESSTITKIVTNFQAVDPSSISILSSGGFNDIVKNLLSKTLNKFDLDSIKSFSFKAKPSYSYTEYENNIIKGAENLKELANPIGLDNISINFNLDLVTQLISDLSEKEARDKATFDATQMDRIRFTLFKINSDVEKNYATFQNVFIQLSNYVINESDKWIIKNYIDNYRDLYLLPVVIKDGNLRDQILDLKIFLSSMTATIRVNLTTLNEILPAIVVLSLESQLQILESFINRYNELLKNDIDFLFIMTETLKNLIDIKGAFTVKGINQSASYNLNSGIDLSLLKVPPFNNLRSSYVTKNHPSVSKLATSYARKTESEREIVDDVESIVPKDHSKAVSADGIGDTLQKNEAVETIPYKGTVGPLDESAWEKYRQKLGEKESSNDYSKINNIGYVGKWQFGGAVLSDFGYVHEGTTARDLKNPNVWTGKDGITDRQTFLSNTKVQDDLLLSMTKRNYKSLLRTKTVETYTKPEIVAGYLAAAHLKGAGGARKLKNGIETADGNGTKTSEYYQMMSSHLSGSMPSGEAVSTAKSIGASEEEQLSAYVDSTTVPDAGTINPPVASATPQYPYNKVNTYEAGHFKEYDSTPGNERIHEKHRTGTGYEIQSDGTLRTHITKDRYSVVLGNDYMIVSGSCHISVKGDVGIKAEGNINIDAANDLNMVVGGDFNVKVGGDKSEIVAGSKNDMIYGDNAEVVSGFKKSSVDGNYSLKGSSVNMTAEDTDINMVSNKNTNMLSRSDVNITNSGNTNISTKGNMKHSAGGSLTAVSDGNATLSSSGAKATLYGGGSSHVVSEGDVNLKGSRIRPSPEIDVAKYALESGKTPILAGVTPILPTGSGSDEGSKSDQTSLQPKADPAKTLKTVENFTPIKGDKTESWTGGQNANSLSYDKGVDIA